MKRAIIASVNYPPSQIASVHRARHLAKYLPSFGWQPEILAVHERFHKEPPDYELGRLSSQQAEVHYVKALPVWATALFGIGDLALRSMVHYARGLDRLLAARRTDVVLFTGWPFYQMLLAARIKRRFGVRILLDFQDPWVSARGPVNAGMSKTGLSHRLAIALEPRAVRSADFITSVSQIQNDEMAARYPWLDPTRMAAIPIGGDPDDFAALRARAPANSAVQLDPKFINLSYVGTFLPRAAPLVRTLLRALGALRDSDPRLVERLRLNFVGTSNQPYGHRIFHVRPIAKEMSVGDLVCETPQRVPFLDALSVLANSQGLLLIGSDEPHYTASKIYPALMSGRPYLSLFHSASSAHRILSGAGGGSTHAFTNRWELEILVPALVQSLRRLITEPESFGSADEAAYTPYTARSVAGEFARLFDKIAAGTIGLT